MWHVNGIDKEFVTLFGCIIYELKRHIKPGHEFIK